MVSAYTDVPPVLSCSAAEDTRQGLPVTVCQGNHKETRSNSIFKESAD